MSQWQKLPKSEVARSAVHPLAESLTTTSGGTTIGIEAAKNGEGDGAEEALQTMV
jgi:hypothetical protein